MQLGVRRLGLIKAIEAVPVVGALARKSYRTALELLDRTSGARQRLAEIEQPYARKLVQTLQQVEAREGGAAREVAFRIEALRRGMLRRNDPVNDGALGDEEIYAFEKQLSVRNACMVSKRPTEALLLYYLTHIFQPKRAIELGTNVGITSAYQAAGLGTYDPPGQLVTLDISPYRQRLAQEMHQALGLHNVRYVQGLFRDTLAETLEALGTIDYAYIDGDHEYQSTVDYFQLIANHLEDGAVVVFDDIRWSAGMKQAWDTVRAMPRVALALDLHEIGVCIVRQEVSHGERASIYIRNVLRVDANRCGGIERYYEASRQAP